MSTEATIADRDKYRSNRTVMTLQAVLIAIGAFAVGIALLVVASFVEWVKQKSGLQNLMNNIGGTVIASVGLIVLWELVGRRSFAREVLETAKYAADIEAAGITSIGTEYLTDPAWDELFGDVERLDIFFAYGRTWRNSNLANLRKLAKRKGCRLRVFLPDPSDDQTVNVLAWRFARTPEKLKADIAEALNEFKELKVDGGAQIEIYHRPGDSLFSCYRFDRIAVITLYNHQSKRGDVPTIVCQSGGSLYGFVVDEMDAIFDQSKQVFPAATEGVDLKEGAS